MKETTLNLTGILSQKFTPKTQGVRTEQLKKQRLIGGVSPRNGQTKKQSPNERKGGSLRNNAK